MKNGNCPNCGAIQPDKAIEYLGDGKYECKACAHKHKWIYAGMCEGEEKPRCGRKTYTCECGAYKDCDGGIN